MKVTILATGSKGNCYLLEGIYNRILIECGIPFKEIRKKLGRKIKDIDICLLSHEHGDHSKSFNDLLNIGIECFSSLETLQIFDPWFFRCEETFETEEFKITRFDVEHDAVDPQGFIILNKITRKKIVFMTDSFYY